MGVWGDFFGVFGDVWGYFWGPFGGVLEAFFRYCGRFLGSKTEQKQSRKNKLQKKHMFNFQYTIFLIGL